MVLVGKQPVPFCLVNVSSAATAFTPSCVTRAGAESRLSVFLANLLAVSKWLQSKSLKCMLGSNLCPSLGNYLELNAKVILIC